MQAYQVVEYFYIHVHVNEALKRVFVHYYLGTLLKCLPIYVVVRGVIPDMIFDQPN